MFPHLRDTRYLPRMNKVMRKINGSNKKLLGISPGYILQQIPEES